MSLKVFISGASGFVGSHLIEHLDFPDYEIFGSTFPDKPEEVAQTHKGEFFYLDIRSERDVLEAIKDIQPDWIFHLAAISNVEHSWEKRAETLETNLIGTFNLLEASRKSNPEARVLFISSSDVYGILTPQEEALKEVDSLQAVNPYAFTKLSGEMLSLFYNQIEKIDVVIARSFSHTGPGQSPAFVCSDWAFQIARIEKGMNKPVIKVGNCKIRRDFSDVRDVVRAYTLLMQKGKSGDIYNVCSGRAIVLKEILDLLLSFSPVKIAVEVDQQKLRKAEIPLLLGDNRKIKEATSWEPKVSLKQSLKDLLEYWRMKI